MTTRKKQEKAPTFESTMASLEEILNRLENQDTSLEDSLGAFQTGISLIRQAQDKLRDAEQRVNVLTEEGNNEINASAGLPEGKG